jgi:hypothetical protein
MLGGFLRSLIVGPVLFVPLVILFIYVMSRNYFRFRKVAFNINLLENEEVLDRFDTDLWFGRRNTILTNQRIVQLSSSWFLSRRKIKSIALQDLHTINWLRHANWLFLIAGIFFLGLINPAAFILFLLGLERKIYLIRFNTPFSKMPLTRIGVVSLRRIQLNELWRFFRNAQLAWAKIRIAKGLSVPPNPVAEEMHEADFAWGRPVWSYLIFFFACGFFQRLAETHISFDDFIFFPFYLGLPIAVAQRSLRDASWTAILGFVALFTVKFPSGGLLSLLVADGGSPSYKQYVLVMITLAAVVFLAYLIAQHVSPDLSYLAVLLWLGFLLLNTPGAIYDIALYAKLLVAIAVAILFAQFERAAGRSYGVV